MPTPSGLLKPGDRLRHRRNGVVAEVVRRHDNSQSYAVTLRVVEAPESTEPVGKEWTMTEAAWWTREPNGDWQLVPSTRTRLDEILVQLCVLAGEQTSEDGHADADDLVCEALTLLGRRDIAEAYDQVGKWFA